MSKKGHTNGVILMTALPPTNGHAQLIEFAKAFLATYDSYSNIYVLVCGREREPVPVWDRAEALRERFTTDVLLKGNSVVVKAVQAELPQNPEDHPDFWNIWAGFVKENVHSFDEDDIIFGSEDYIRPLGETLGCRYIPYNIYRETVGAKATLVRNDPISNFNMVLKEFQPYLRKTVTIFGAESTGKTTISKKLAKTLGSTYIPEWAREYMEKFEPAVNDTVMENIVRGQYASQHAARKIPNSPFIIQDTDLISTEGYYRIYGGTRPEELERCINLTKSDLYLVMNSNIPFEEDPLRFGGDVRESTDEFWIDLLDEYGANYHVVESTGPFAQLVECAGKCIDLFMGHPLFSFTRD